MRKFNLKALITSIAIAVFSSSCGRSMVGSNPAPIPHLSCVTPSFTKLLYQNNFTATGSMNAARGNLIIVTLANAQALVIGGGVTTSTSVEPSLAPELYGSANETFSVVGQAGFDDGAGLQNGCALLIAASSAAVFSPGTMTFSATGAPIPDPTRPPDIVLKNGDVLRCGGGGAIPGASDVNMCQRYDPIAGEFIRAGMLNGDVVGHAGAPLQDGRVLFIGGEVFIDGVRPFISVARAEIYDPVTETATDIAPMTVPRAGHTATTLSDGRVLIVGGQDDNYRSLSSAEVFDPSTNTFTLIGNMSVAREKHTATLLSDGRVLIAGGSDGTTTLNTAEIFDPNTNTFGLPILMMQARASHAATMLTNGEVLIVGGTTGTTGNFAPTASAEIFK